MMKVLSQIIASELKARPEQVDAAVCLLDEGNTVPFIARYRKEVTGGLDDTQLRQLEGCRSSGRTGANNTYFSFQHPVHLSC